MKLTDRKCALVLKALVVYKAGNHHIVAKEGITVKSVQLEQEAETALLDAMIAELQIVTKN